jgi:hypothetical protein
VVVIGVFKYGTCVCHINDNRSSAFDSSRYHHFKKCHWRACRVRVEVRKLLSYLLLTTFTIAFTEKHVGINYIFFSNRLSSLRSGEKGKVSDFSKFR